MTKITDVFMPLLFFVAIGVAAIVMGAEEPKLKSIAVMRHIDGPRYYRSEVTKIVDGDTVYLRFKVWTDITLDKKIRFEDIDTWEVTGEGKEKGLAAKKFLTELLGKGKVYLNTSGKTGKYGRTLGSLYILDGEEIIDVTKELRAHGHEKN